MNTPFKVEERLKLNSVNYCAFLAKNFKPWLQLQNNYRNFVKILNPQTTEKICGLDANSLYLHAIALNNLTGYFCRYKESENY